MTESRPRVTRILGLVFGLVGSVPAGAQPISKAVEPRRERPPAGEPRPAQPLPAPIVLPRPDEADGFEVPPEPPVARARWIPRVLLFFPRVGFEIVSQPVRGGLWLSDRYQLKDKVVELLFTDDLTFGVYPVAYYRTGFGFDIGARARHTDLFGDGEHLSLQANYGGRYRGRVAGKLDTGDRLGPLVLGVAGGYESRPRERFFGIGNLDDRDLSDADVVPMGVDPFATDIGFSTRYRDSTTRGYAAATWIMPYDLRFELRGGAEKRSLGPWEGDDSPSLEDVYDTSMLTGYDDGADAWFGELRAGIDTRTRDNIFTSTALPSRGYLVSAYAGYNAPISEDRDAFLRWGVDLQLCVNVFRGNRILVLRGLVDQVQADPEDIPFIYLPSLGGDDLLRGYVTDRFRDRALTLVSAEYTWEISRHLYAFVFADGGRVQRSLTDPSLEDLRLGFGGGFEVATENHFVMRAHMGSSIDGGLVFNLAFDPVIEPQAGRY